MIFGYLILLTALILSAVAAYYSVTGLVAIFSALPIPIIIMGATLEAGKIVSTVWLHNNWKRAGIAFKLYLVPAIVVLMLLTSVGIFGLLSKAHLDQNIPSGDAQTKVAIYDEKIKTAKDNIEANRKALKQMDESVDQLMARTTDDTGAQRAANMRRSQAKERGTLQADIQKNQTDVAKFNQERAPLAAEFRKIEAEVGPIKYVAALLYGESADVNVLEKAVRFVIIMIVIVFDPLALCLILAANKQFEWARQGAGGFIHDEQPESAETKQDLGIAAESKYEADDGPLTDEQLKQIQDLADKELPTKEVITKDELFPPAKDPHPPGWIWANSPAPVIYPNTDIEVEEFAQAKQKAKEEIIIEAPHDPLSHIEVPEIHPEDRHHLLAKQSYLAQHPEIDERVFHAQHQDGEIDRLPWHDAEHINTLPISDGERKQLIDRFVDNSPPKQVISEPKSDGNLWVTQPNGTWVNAGPMDQFNLGLSADNRPKSATGEMRGFGTNFPSDSDRGDMFLRVDQLPSALYKFNGTNWIEVDKKLSDQYLYDEAYIDHLVEKISTGEYDPDLLSDAERESIEKRLVKKV